MNKDKTRHPVPENKIEMFMPMTWMLAKLTGVDEIRAVCHHLQLCQEEIDRYLFNKNHQVSSDSKANTERRRFIAIFKNRYLELEDAEYYKAISPLDAKLIEQTNNALEEKGFTCDEYLKWLFEVFLQDPDNRTFRTPSIRWACCGFALAKFYLDNNDLLKEKREKEIRKRESLALMARGRQVMRQSKDHAEIEKIKNIIKGYADGRIMLDGLRKGIEECENAHAQSAADETGQSSENEAVIEE